VTDRYSGTCRRRFGRALGASSGKTVGLAVLCCNMSYDVAIIGKGLAVLCCNMSYDVAIIGKGAGCLQHVHACIIQRTPEGSAVFGASACPACSYASLPSSRSPAVEGTAIDSTPSVASCPLRLARCIISATR
jgi:hypothetical protein